MKLLPHWLLATLIFGLALGCSNDDLAGQVSTAELERAHFAADAGILAVLADIRQGEDVGDPDHALRQVHLNGYSVAVSIKSPPAGSPQRSRVVLVDPGASDSLAALGPGERAAYVINDVRPSAEIVVNWGFAPGMSEWGLEVVKGAGAQGSLVAYREGGSSPARLFVDPDEILGGTYTVVFVNRSDRAVNSSTFGPLGESSRTWLRVEASKTYLVTSTAGPVTLSVLATSRPGANQHERSVDVFEWQDVD